MTGMNSVLLLGSLVLLEGGHEVVNPLPFPTWVFFLISFVILLALLEAVRMIGKHRPHS